MVTRAAPTGATIVEMPGDPDDLAPGVATAAHPLVQESLTNAFRRALNPGSLPAGVTHPEPGGRGKVIPEGSPFEEVPVHAPTP